MKGKLFFLYIQFFVCLLTATAQTVTEYSISDSALTQPGYMAKAPDNKIWVTFGTANRVARFSESGVLELSITPTTASSNPSGITIGSDNNVWFTMRGSNKIGKIPYNATAQSELVEYAVPGGGGPNQIVSAGDKNLWFTLTDGNAIGRISTSGQFQDPSYTSSALTNSSPVGIVADGEQLYFTMFATGKIGRIKTDGTFQSAFDLTTGSSACGPTDIIIDSNSILWFTEFNCNKIGKMTTSGTHTEYTAAQLTSNSSQVRNIVAGPAGSPMFFTLTNDNRIGMIAPNGTFIGYLDASNGITASSQPFDIMLGNNGFLWFSEYATAKLAKFTPSNILSISTESLDSGAIGTAYTETIEGTGGTAPYTFSVSSSSLPPGLSLDSNGTLSGTPTTAGEYSMLISITDNNSIVNNKTLTVSIGEADLPDLSSVLNSFSRRNNNSLRIKASPTNSGLQPSTQFSLSVYLSKDINYSSNDKLVGSKSISSLEVGTGKKYSFSYKGSLANRRYIIACVDVDNTVAEQDDTNNCDYKKFR